MSAYKEYRFSDLIEEVEERNISLEYGLDDIVGVTIEKGLIPTIANLTQTALDKFYIVKPDTFVYNPRTHGVRLGMGYNDTNKTFLTSWNNVAFRVKEDAKKIVLSKYLWIYFNRPEWDRQTNFMAWGSSTIVFAWNDFLSIKIKLPDLKEQEKIVNTYNAITKRIQLKQKINENLEKTAQTIYRKIFVEDADEKWETVKLEKVIEVKYGKDHKNLEEGNIPVYGSGGIMRYANKYLYDKESVMIPRKGSLNNIIYTDEPFWSVDTMFYTSMKKQNFAKYFYEFIRTKDFLNLDTGSAVPSMTTDYLNNIEILNPDNTTLEKFESKVSRLYISKKNNYKEISKLQELKQLVISRISGM